ncbi:hypothetical protein EB796_018423 [Bugula neritina]|uniref:EIF2AK4 n=1 Tax=Bugula neritina TaxID=10212 RepID=A0A7J7JCB3_BUGNE|nr:hypothetical protein EB796_018423 [Bugula neritina]
MASSAIFENKNALQEDELEAIKAIFVNVKDLRLNDVWKVNRPPEVEIECTPQSSDSIDAASHNYVSVVLVIKLVPAYPDEIPSITLKDAEGLSDKQVYELKTKLKGLCEDLIGQEMMFELVNYTQSYLYANNKPPAKSFYDQMISNNQKQTEEKARKAEEVERLKRIQEDLEIEAELEKQQNEIREENRRRRQARKMSESEERHAGTSPTTRVSTTSPRRRTRTESSTSSERSATRASVQPVKVAPKCPANHKLVKELSFSTSKTQYQVLRGHCTYHDPAGCTLFPSFDTTRGVAVSVQQWTLDFTSSKVTKDQNLNKSHKLLNSAEQDLAKLFKVQDENLIHYLSMLITTEGAKIHIMVLSEARLGLPLTKFVHLPSKIDSGTVKWITAQLVQSLVYLHSKQVVHKDLKPAVIYVDSKIVRVADYGLYRRLNEIQQAATSGNLDSLTNTMKRGQKEDVFRLGMTILFIITKDFNEDERMPTVPTDVAKDLKGFFTRCFNADEKTRWSAKQLLDHPYIKGEQLSDDVPDKPPAVNQNNKPEYEVDDPHMEAVLLPEGAGASRLNSEFQILGIIGRGGFGEVLKVRNKLDRCLYAIKRITLNPKSKVFNRRITREVKLLSRLNHENVVRYFNSWIETSEELAESDSTTDTTTSTSPGVRRKLEEDSCSVERNAPGMVDRSVTWSVASSQHDSDSTSSDDESSSDEADLFGHSFMSRVDSDSDVIFDDGSSAGNTSSHVDESSGSGATKVQKSPPKPAAPLHTQFMYIQMEFCEKNTLRQAIDSGLHENLDRVWRLFREVIEGLVHLHDQGMIHRDLKPVNIFLDLNDHVKIGDFGLATTAMIAKLPEGGMGGVTDQTHSVDAGVSQSMSVGDGRHTGRVGTLLYVSPEIKSSHGKTSYSQKVDIYSLGIIFFEMCYRPLTTLMERDKIIGNIRRPEIILPNDFICEQNAKQVLE